MSALNTASVVFSIANSLQLFQGTGILMHIAHSLSLTRQALMSSPDFVLNNIQSGSMFGAHWKKDPI